MATITTKTTAKGLTLWTKKTRGQAAEHWTVKRCGLAYGAALRSGWAVYYRHTCGQWQHQETYKDEAEAIAAAIAEMNA
jgi:transposase-like protein